MLLVNVIGRYDSGSFGGFLGFGKDMITHSFQALDTTHVNRLLLNIFSKAHLPSSGR